MIAFGDYQSTATNVYSEYWNLKKCNPFLVHRSLDDWHKNAHALELKQPVETETNSSYSSEKLYKGLFKK